MKRRILLIILAALLLLAGCGSTSAMTSNASKRGITESVKCYFKENGEFVEYELYDTYIESVSNTVNPNSIELPYFSMDGPATGKMIVMTNRREIIMDMRFNEVGDLYLAQPDLFSMAFEVGPGLSKGEYSEKLTYQIQKGEKTYYITQLFSKRPSERSNN